MAVHPVRPSRATLAPKPPPVTLPQRVTPVPVRASGQPVRLLARRHRGGADAGPRRGVGGFLARRVAALPPGWPLKYLLVGFPLWWVLGLNTLIFPLLAVPMLLQLRRVRTLRFPPGMWLWWLFLAWQIIGVAMIELSPPGTHPGSVSGRLISLVFSMVEYAGVTVTLLYVGNLDEDDVPQSAVARWMGAFFLTVFAGGLLGLIAPKLTFRSAIEFVLPAGIRSNGFVHALVHPVTAQVQDVIGSGNGRPSAPFGYTNTWGNTLSILLVWFVAAWLIPARGQKRTLAAVVVLVTLVPIVLSLNRGLWIGLAVTFAWVLLRMMLQGHIGTVLATLVSLAVAGVVVLVSPLGTVIQDRLTHGVSDNIRSFVAEKSIVAVENSPIVGYGSNRHADGSSNSITVGPSPNCPKCGDVPTGSTGQLWSVMFNSGLIGTVLYFGFFLASIGYYWRQRGPIAEAALITIMLTFVYMFFYSALPVAPTLTMIAVGVLWRTRSAPAPVRPVLPAQPVGPR